MTDRSFLRYLGSIGSVLSFLFIAAPAPALAQEEEAVTGITRTQEPPYSHALAPRASTVRVDGQIRIDGRLDDPPWAAAEAITGFIQLDPAEGSPATERTEVRIVYDDQAIYVSAALYDGQPLTTRLARRDGAGSDSDLFVVLIDSYHDHETAYSFSANPSGVKGDRIVSGGGTGGGDASWDPIWELATAQTEWGWVAEMRIPFSQLRFSRDEDQTWGIQFERVIHRNQEHATFPFTPKLERGGVARFAHLDGIRGVEPGRRLELLPYMAARGEFLQLSSPDGIDFSNPYRSGSDFYSAVGLDLKYGLSSNLTLDATVNPDFGQVELDPAVINLTAFETRFDERRPFFVEGADIFRFGEGGPAGSTGRGPQLLYSRRIGRAPQGSVPGDAVYSEVESATTILGAAKITGRIGDGWSVGLLEAVTSRESASYVDGEGVGHRVVVEAPANYLVGRVRRQLGDGETRFGLIASAAHRDLSGTGLENRVHSAAYAGGADFKHEWSNRSWRLSSTLTGSYVRGETGAINRTQRSAARYFHRPDADHLTEDLDATSMAGYYAMVDLVKQAGAVGAKVAVAFASPGYEVNDLGFQSAADRIILDTNFSYEQNRPGRRLRNWNVRGSPDAIWNYGGERVFTEVNGNFGWQWLNYWGGGIRLAYNPATDDDRLTRGGPLARQPRGYSGGLNFNSDGRRSHVANMGIQWSRDDGGSSQTGVNLNFTSRPRETLEIRVGPRLSWGHTAAQYVTTVNDPEATATDGRRFVFAGLDQTTVSVQARLNVTFTPNLSLQLYAEPFVSNGDYGALKEFSERRTFDFTVYGRDAGTMERREDGTFEVDPDGAGPADPFTVRDRDFSFRSLLGNAVLRWEWRPGSTLFLVWQQRRSERIGGDAFDSEDQGIGRFDLGRDVGDLFSIRPDNVFMIKVNYWLNP